MINRWNTYVVPGIFHKIVSSIWTVVKIYWEFVLSFIKYMKWDHAQQPTRQWSYLNTTSIKFMNLLTRLYATDFTFKFIVACLWMTWSTYWTWNSHKMNLFSIFVSWTLQLIAKLRFSYSNEENRYCREVDYFLILSGRTLSPLLKKDFKNHIEKDLCLCIV